MSETIDKRMTTLAAQIAASAARACEAHPGSAGSIIELAMSGATALEFGRRLLVAYNDIEAAVFTTTMAELVLSSINGHLQSGVEK
jgi:hypothetical protein